jgi:hypothetical protein
MTKVKKIRQFQGYYVASIIKKASFCKKKFYLKNLVKYGLDPELEPKLFQSLNRNRNKKFRFYNTLQMLVLLCLTGVQCTCVRVVVRYTVVSATSEGQNYPATLGLLMPPSQPPPPPLRLSLVRARLPTRCRRAHMRALAA